MAATTHLKPTARLRGNVEEDDEVMISSHIYTYTHFKKIYHI